MGTEFSIPSGWSDDDITAVIGDVTDIINRITGDNFESVSQSLMFDGNGRGVLFLNQLTPLRLLSVTKIQYRSIYDSTDNFDADGNELDADNYVPYPYYLVRIRNDELRVRGQTMVYASRSGTHRIYSSIWLKGWKNYKITGTWGHTAVPEGIKWCAVLLARERIRPGSTAPYAMKQSVRYVDMSYAAPYPGLLPVVTGVQAVDFILPRYKNRVPSLRAFG